MSEDICRNHLAGKLHSPMMILRDTCVPGTSGNGCSPGVVEWDPAEESWLCCPLPTVTLNINDTEATEGQMGSNRGGIGTFCIPLSQMLRTSFASSGQRHDLFFFFPLTPFKSD